MHVLWMLKRNMNSLSGSFISLCWKHSKPCYWKLLSPFKCACARVCMCVPNHVLSFEDSRLKSAHWDVSNFAFLFCTDQFWSPPSAQRGTTALGSEAPIPARGSPGRNSNPGCLCLAGCWKMRSNSFAISSGKQRMRTGDCTSCWRRGTLRSNTSRRK